MNGKIIWFFGRPCSGKTTLAKKLVESFEKSGMKVQHLDGDVVRKKFTKDLGFSIEDRFENIRRMGYLADALSKHSINVIASFVTPLRAYRIFLERILGERLLFIECDSTLDVCMERDVKGMYEEALFGRIKDFTGLTSPYEASNCEENTYVIDTDVYSEEDSINRIKGFLKVNSVF